MRGFVLRNLRVFFRDKSAVFFSLLAVFVVLGLYVLFLGDVWVDGFSDQEGVRFLMNSWIMAGLLAITAMTTTMGAFGLMVEDRAKKLIKDFTVAPMRRGVLAGGYLAAAVIVGLLMSLVALVFAEGYILAEGGRLLSLQALAKVLGLIVLSVCASSSMVFFMVSFFKSQNAFATASTIVGTLAGFLTGVYVPMGSLPASVQLAIKLFPISHAAALFRRVMMEEPLGSVFAGAPVSQLADFEQNMGVTLLMGERVISPLSGVLFLIASTALFFGLAVLNLSRKQK